MHNILAAEVPNPDFIGLSILLREQVLNEDAVGLLSGVLVLFALVKKPLDRVGFAHLPVA